MSFHHRVFILLGASVLACFAQDPLAPSTWLDHLNNELLPFWSHPDALGRNGDFPAIRCDDGTAVNWQRPCREIATNAWLMQRPRNVVAQSRQVYAYGVAFHMTGDRKYLDWMKSGLDYLRREVVDRQNGGIATNQDARTGAWGPRPEWRNPQELAYGLVGFSFYYYLTRDPEVLTDIVAIKRYIFSNYFDNDAQVMKWLQSDNGAELANDRKLVATLDQMNAYMVLLVPILPEPYQSEWKADLTRLSIVLIEKFYNWDENLFYLSSNTSRDRDPGFSATDFGHTIKAMWMIRWTGLLTGNPEFVWFSETYGRQVLERAFQPGNGSWASGVAAKGEVDLNKSWWIYAELDQFAATLSLQEPELGSRYLQKTYGYWRTYLVDHQYAEVWTTVDGRTNAPLANDQPKQWPWKNGYHSLEHALVAYITTSASAGQPVKLFFAHEPDGSERPYFFSAERQTAERVNDVVVSITFDRIQ